MPDCLKQFAGGNFEIRFSAKIRRGKVVPTCRPAVSPPIETSELLVSVFEEWKDVSLHPRNLFGFLSLDKWLRRCPKCVNPFLQFCDICHFAPLSYQSWQLYPKMRKVVVQFRQ
jgi:hypothetical protein